MLVAAVLLPLALRVPPPEDTAKLLERQTQELLDAINFGPSAVWEAYLDPGAIYVDESGVVLSKKEMVEGIRPLPEAVSARSA